MTEYAVLVIPAACNHIVHVQLCGDFETNQARIAAAQKMPCADCWAKEIDARTEKRRATHPESFASRAGDGTRDKRYNGVS